MAHVASPVLVGRDAELDALIGQLDASLGRAGRVVFVSGEAGIGKSRLVQSAADAARARGVRVLAGRTAQVGSPVPFRPLIEALQSAVDPEELNTPRLVPYQAALAGLFPIEGYVTSPSIDSPLAVMEGLRRLLGVVAEPEGLLLVVEDLHWADPETLAFLEYLADKVGDTPILCLATERSDTSDDSAELIAGLAARRLASRVVLGPLRQEHVSELARCALATEAVPVTLGETLRTRSQGVPFLVEELLSAYVSSGGPTEHHPEWWTSHRIAGALPPSYRELVRDRLDRLEPAARAVVSAAAVLGRGFDWKLLAPVTDLADTVVLEGLRAAVRTQLLATRGDHYTVTFEFRHALAREAILAELLPPEQADLALRAAGAIEATYPGVPGEWCERAAELREMGGDQLGAARLLQEAARRMMSRSALQSAERTLLRARDLAAEDWMTWMGAEDLLLDVLALAGKTEGVLELGRHLIDTLVARYGLHNTAARLGDVHLRLARALLATGDAEMITPHLDQAEHLAAAAGDESLQAQVAASRALGALAAGDIDAAATVAADAERLADVIASPRITCEALHAGGQVALHAGKSAQAVDRFQRLVATASTPRLTVWKARALLELGTIERLRSGATDQLEEARVLSLASGAVAVHAAVELQLAHASLDLADTARAAAHLELCEDACQLYRLPLLAEVLVARCLLHALGERSDAMEASAAQARRMGANAADVAGNGRAVLALVRGDDRGALQHLRDALAVSPGGNQPSWRGLHALLAIALHGDGSALGALVTSPAAWHPTDRAYLDYASAVGLGRSGNAPGALSAFAHADATMVPGWRRHHARRVVADAAFDAAWGEPILWASEALEFFEAARLRGAAAACKSLLRRAGEPVRRRGRGESEVPAELHRLGVTSREMDVLHLVAERLGNRAIAQQLYLSPRTVESHVATLVRKCGVENRSALVDLGRRCAAATGEATASDP